MKTIISQDLKSTISPTPGQLLKANCSLDYKTIALQ